MQDFGRQAGQVLYSDVFFRHGRRWGKPCRDRLVARRATVSPPTESDFRAPACDGRLAMSRRAEGVHSCFFVCRAVLAGVWGDMVVCMRVLVRWGLGVYAHDTRFHTFLRVFFFCVRVDRSWLVGAGWLLCGVGTVDVCYHTSLGPVSRSAFVFYMAIDQQLSGVRSGTEGTEALGDIYRRKTRRAPYIDRPLFDFKVVLNDNPTTSSLAFNSTGSRDNFIQAWSVFRVLVVPQVLWSTCRVTT